MCQFTWRELYTQIPSFSMYRREQSSMIVLLLSIKFQKNCFEMQTRNQLWEVQMVLSCLTEHYLVGWDLQHYPTCRPTRPGCFPRVAAHHPLSQTEENELFWTLGLPLSVLIIVIAIKQKVYILGTPLRQKSVFQFPWFQIQSNNTIVLLC